MISAIVDVMLPGPDDLPPPAVLAAEIAEDLQAALEEIQTLAETLVASAAADEAATGGSRVDHG